MIRVLHVIGIMNIGGAETMIMNLYRHIDREQIQFDFVENSFDSAAFDEEITSLGGRIYRCPHYNGKNHFQYIKWWNLFFKEHAAEYAIVHGHLGSTAAIYLSIAKRNGCFTIAHSHSVYADLTWSSFLYRIYAYPTRYIADLFFACSREAGISRYGKRIGENSKKCEIIRNAIEIQKYDYNPLVRAECRRELGIREQLVVGHVGRFEEVKNHKFLLDIFKEILVLQPQSVLILVGDGALRDDIVKKTNVMGIDDAVKILGVRNDVHRLLQAMDVMIFPSVYEGSPFALIEGQASGLPCLMSDRVPSGIIISSSEMRRLPLEVEASIWASEAMKLLTAERRGHMKELAEAGYDINCSADRISRLYLNAASIRTFNCIHRGQ